MNNTRERSGDNSETINDEIVATADNLLEYKCLSTKQHNILLLKC